MQDHPPETDQVCGDEILWRKRKERCHFNHKTLKAFPPKLFGFYGSKKRRLRQQYKRRMTTRFHLDDTYWTVSDKSPLKHIHYNHAHSQLGTNKTSSPRYQPNFLSSRKMLLACRRGFQPQSIARFLHPIFRYAEHLIWILSQLCQ